MAEIHPKELIISLPHGLRGRVQLLEVCPTCPSEPALSGLPGRTTAEELWKRGVAAGVMPEGGGCTLVFVTGDSVRHLPDQPEERNRLFRRRQQLGREAVPTVVTRIKAAGYQALKGALYAL